MSLLGNESILTQLLPGSNGDPSGLLAYWPVRIYG